MGSRDLLSTMEYTQITEVFQALNLTSNDYFFILDFQRDMCSFGRRILDRFRVSSETIQPASEELRKLVVEEDYPILNADLKDLADGKKVFHDLQYRWYTRDNQPSWVHCRGTVVHNMGGRLSYLVGSISEIRDKMPEDSLTGLGGEQELAFMMRGYLLSGKTDGFIMLVGVDNFKEINEKFGLDSGNQVLCELKEIIRDCIAPDMLLYRMVADEYVIVKRGSCPAGEGDKLYQRIRRGIFQHLEQDGYAIFYTVSAGILQGPYTTDSYVDIMRYLEFSINEAKRSGKNRLTEFNMTDYEAYMNQLEIREELRRAVFNDFEGFYLDYQPIVDANNFRVRGAEALLRWNSMRYGRIPPSVFVPIMEESGLIIPMGNKVLEEAVSCCERWRRWHPDFRMNINLSYVQLKKSEILTDLKDILGSARVSPENIMLEITESGYIETDSAFRTVVEQMTTRYGVRLAIDDFGTGYSNLRYLKDLRAEMVKIDRSFVLRALESSSDFTLLGHIVEMAHSIGLKVCLEGIETEDEFQRMKELNPDSIQGFLFGRPVSEKQFLEKYLLQCDLSHCDG